MATSATKDAAVCETLSPCGGRGHAGEVRAQSCRQSFVVSGVRRSRSSSLMRHGDAVTDDAGRSATVISRPVFSHTIVCLPVVATERQSVIARAQFDAYKQADRLSRSESPHLVSTIRDFAEGQTYAVSFPTFSRHTMSLAARVYR
jgi:hypothetical protein